MTESTLTREALCAELEEQIYGLKLRAEMAELVALHFRPHLDAELNSPVRKSQRMWLLREYTFEQERAAQRDRAEAAVLQQALDALRESKS